MANVELAMGNLVGGVSQQPVALRALNQHTEVTNGYLSPVEGLLKRHPTRHLAEIANSAYTNPFLHTINRDANERYVVVATTAGIQVFDTVDGSSVFVQDLTGGYGYFAGATPSTDFRALTVDDFTFIVNTAQTTAMAGTTSAAPANTAEAYIFVRQGNFSSDYVINITQGANNYSVTTTTWDGVTVVAGEVMSLKTDLIAQDLANKINALGGASTIVATRAGSVVRLTDTSAFDSISTEDSIGDSVLALVHNEVPRVAGFLPEICTNGFKVKIIGDAEAQADDYFVEFVADGGGTTFGRGYWQETIDYSTPFEFDASTMPHQLVRRIDDGVGTVTGTAFERYFSFETVSWDDRIVGDTTLVPDPSFIGSTISSIFFHQDRLGLLSDENVLLSESGQFFNFWRRTMLALLDSDTIDVSAAHTKVALLRHAVTNNENLVLFSNGGTQFIMRGDPLFSPRTISLSAVTEFETLEQVEPLPTGRTIIFPYKRGDQSGAREFFQIDEANYDAVDLTTQVPNYIQGEITKLTGSTLEEVMVALTDTERDTLWVYKYLWRGTDKVQSAWCKYTLGSGAIVLNADFIENMLYLVVQRGTDVYLERMDISTGLKDTGSDYLTLVDRRVDNDYLTAQSLTVTYSASVDQTTIQLPYVPSSDRDPSVISKAGVIFNVVATDRVSNPPTTTVQGDLTGEDFWVGEEYSLVLKPTQPILKERSDSGGVGVVTPGRYQRVRMARISYHDSRFFKVTIQVDNRTPYEYTFDGPTVGRAVIDQPDLSTGVFEVPVRGRADLVEMTIENDSPFPCILTSIEWLTQFSPKGQRFRG